MRMTNGELECGADSGGDADHVDLVQGEMVQQFDEGVGLCGAARIRRQRRSEVTEPGRDDDATTVDQIAQANRPPSQPWKMPWLTISAGPSPRSAYSITPNSVVISARSTTARRADAAATRADTAEPRQRSLRSQPRSVQRSQPGDACLDRAATTDAPQGTQARQAVPCDRVRPAAMHPSAETPPPNRAPARRESVRRASRTRWCRTSSGGPACCGIPGCPAIGASGRSTPWPWSSITPLASPQPGTPATRMLPTVSISRSPATCTNPVA